MSSFKETYNKLVIIDLDLRKETSVGAPSGEMEHGNQQVRGS